MLPEVHNDFVEDKEILDVGLSATERIESGRFRGRYGVVGMIYKTRHQKSV